MSKYIKEENQSNNSYLSSSSKYYEKKKSKYSWDDEEKSNADADEKVNSIPAMPTIPTQITRERSKGKTTSIQSFNDSNAAQKNNKWHIHHETVEQKKEHKKDSLIRMIVFILILLFASILLELFKIRLPFIPTFLGVDFSIFPEFVSTVFFGPFVGIGTVVVKNLVHVLIFYLSHGHVSYVGELSNLITDVVFIFIAFVIYHNYAGKLKIRKSTRKRRRLGVLISGAGSSLATAVIKLPVMKLIIYPLFVKYFESKNQTIDFLAIYTEKLPSITSVWQGLLVFNLPLEFGKLLLVTIFASVTYFAVTSRE